MIPDVQRTPEGGDLRRQVAEAYRQLAILRDNVDYELGVLGDAVSAIEADGSIAALRADVEDLRRQIWEIIRAAEVEADAASVFSLSALGFASSAAGVSGAGAASKTAAFALSSLGYTYTSSATAGTQ